jgi:hypothetical protein
LKIEGLKVPLSPNNQTYAKAIVSAPSKPVVHAGRVTSITAVKDRRRGQRVLLRVRASIHLALQGQAAETLDVATLSVNPHGAVVVVNRSLAAETHLVLEHSGTRQQIACKVVRPPRQMPEGYHVPLEFDSPAPNFWKIDFPSPDWRADDV